MNTQNIAKLIYENRYTLKESFNFNEDYLLDSEDMIIERIIDEPIAIIKMDLETLT